jgi:predicted amidohydrolase YtcJ
VRVQEIDALKALIGREQKGEDLGGTFLSVGMVKFFSDGSLGSRTAAMKQPYQGTCQCGFLLQPLDELRSGIYDAVRSGFQCCVHAIGDAAVAHAVDAIVDAITAVELSAASAGEPKPLRRRHRIEHCQHVDDIPALFPRMAEFGIVASCQPSHLLVDGPYAERELGPERMKGAYCFRSMLDHKVPLAFGSDWMVAPACVLTSIKAAVSRCYEDTTKGSNRSINVWNATEALTVEEALEAYTAGAAASGHQDHHVGHLLPGYLADVTVISSDLLASTFQDFTGAAPFVAFTIINGKIVFCR